MTKVTHLTADEHGGLNRRRIHLREISGESDAPLETVGQYLRAARMRRGDDLATVSRALKIRKDHLEAIEEDRLESLPGRTYAVGFVRSYADYLGLDPVQAVDRFKGEIAGRGDGGHQITLTPESQERRLPHGWVVIAIVLLAVVAYGAYHLARSADSLLKEPIAPVPARIAPPPVARFVVHRPAVAVATPSPKVQLGSPANAATASTNPQITPPRPASSIAPSAAAGNVAVAANPAATAQQTASGATTPGQTGASQDSAPSTGQDYGAQNKDARVILRATATTRVLVQGADGTVFINRVLRPGDTYRVPDKVGLTLTTPDGGSVALELDGQQMGTAGTQGQVTEALSLDPQSIVDRYSGGNPG